MITPEPLDFADLQAHCEACGLARWAHALERHPFDEALPLWPDQVPDTQLVWLEPEQGKRRQHV